MVFTWLEDIQTIFVTVESLQAWAIPFENLRFHRSALSRYYNFKVLGALDVRNLLMMGSVNKLTHMPYQKKNLLHLNKDWRSNGNFVGESASYPDSFLTQGIWGILLKEQAVLNSMFLYYYYFFFWPRKEEDNKKFSALYLCLKCMRFFFLICFWSPSPFLSLILV